MADVTIAGGGVNLPDFRWKGLPQAQSPAPGVAPRYALDTSPTGLPSFNPGPGTMPLPEPGQFRVPTTDPGFGQVLENINQPINVESLPDIQSPGSFAGTQTEGIRPEIQSVLDILQKRSGEAETRGASTAQALAVRRGLAGSSIEQFGVQEGAAGARRGFEEQQANVLLENTRQNLQRQQQLEQLTSTQEIAKLQAAASRGNKQAEIELSRRLEQSRLTSDEVASQRNMDLQLQSLRAQQILGERGLALTAQNIQMAEEAARRESRDSLIGNLIGTVGSQVIGKIIGGGGSSGGLIGKLMGSGSTASGAAGSTASSTGGSTTGLFGKVKGGLGTVGGKLGTLSGVGTSTTGASSSHFGGALGKVGTGKTALGSAGKLLGGIGLGTFGAIAGSKNIRSKHGSNKTTATGAAVGGIAGGFLGYLYGGSIGAGVGGYVGANIGGAVAKPAAVPLKFFTKAPLQAVKKLFPF